MIKFQDQIIDVYLYMKKLEYNRNPFFYHYAPPFSLKRVVMSTKPSIITQKLRPQDMFLIFASDGLWEQLSDEDVVKIVHKNPKNINGFLF